MNFIILTIFACCLIGTFAAPATTTKTPTKGEYEEYIKSKEDQLKLLEISLECAKAGKCPQVDIHMTELVIKMVKEQVIDEKKTLETMEKDHSVSEENNQNGKEDGPQVQESFVDIFKKFLPDQKIIDRPKYKPGPIHIDILI